MIKNIFKKRIDKPISRKDAQSRYYLSKIEEKTEEVDKPKNIVETKINKAINDGLFDNLPGKGHPIDLKSYFSIPEHSRLAYHILKNSNFLPKEVKLKKEIEALKEKIKNSSSEKEKWKLKKKLNSMSQSFSFYLESNVNRK